MNNNNLEETYTCPSFSSYSTDNKVSQIAHNLVVELGEEDFEFTFIRDDEVSTEEFRQVYPVFDHDLLPLEKSSKQTELLNVPNQDDPTSCSSSEEADDELDEVPPGSYCVWRPKPAESASPSRCKKSNSTGSVPTKRTWKFRDFLRRSNSEGKDSFVFLTPKKDVREEKVGSGSLMKGKGKSVISAHEALYVRNRAVKEGEKKKSYLPYRQGLVGFFVNANGFRNNLPHF